MEVQVIVNGEVAGIGILHKFIDQGHAIVELPNGMLIPLPLIDLQVVRSRDKTKAKAIKTLRSLMRADNDNERQTINECLDCLERP